MAELQQNHAEQLAAVKAGFDGSLMVSKSELSEAKSSLASTREQHAKSLAELQKRLDSQLTAAESKHAVMLAASHAELAAARQHNIQQWLDLDQGYKNKLAQPLHSSLPLQADPHHSAAVAQAYSQLLPAVAKHPSDEAPFPHLPASLQGKLMTLKQHSSQAAATVEAQFVVAGESECRALRQSLTALEKQLSLAQAEVLVHASTSVGRFELVCKLKAAAQGNKHCWTATDDVQQMQQLMQSVAGAVRKQKQADHTAAVAGDSQSTQQHAVTSVNQANGECGSANNYPSDEDDLDDWTQEEEDDDASDADYARQPVSTTAAASDSQSTWTTSAGVTDCSSSSCIGSFLQSDIVQETPHAASSRAETAGSAISQHARQGTSAELQISPSVQTSSRSFAAANVTVFTTAVEPDVINSHPPERTFGSQVMPAANSGIASGNDHAGCATRDRSGEAATAGVAGSLVSHMYESEEHDLGDWTCDEDDACANGGCCCAVTSGSVVEARISSALLDYLSDEDDLDDWTQEDVDE